MRFEVQAKYGGHWADLCCLDARDSRQAAFIAQYIHNRHRLRVRPEYSRGGYFTYRITSAPQVTS